MLSHEAKRQFRIIRHPFPDDIAGPDDVYLSDEYRYIASAMFQTAKSGGILAVVGESGSGKTTLRRALIDRITREGESIQIIQPVLEEKERLTASHISDAILADLGAQKYPIKLERKAREVRRLLTGSSRAGNRHVLIIEEAHDVTVHVLKQLKRFWEIEDGFQKLLSIILIGQPELIDKLDEKKNWQARELIRRCQIAELRPLNGDLEKYIEHKFARAGMRADLVFESDAYDALRERLTLRQREGGKTISMLYPLVVHNAVVRAMNLAAKLGVPKVGADIVRGL